MKARSIVKEEMNMKNGIIMIFSLLCFFLMTHSARAQVIESFPNSKFVAPGCVINQAGDVSNDPTSSGGGPVSRIELEVRKVSAVNKNAGVVDPISFLGVNEGDTMVILGIGSASLTTSSSTPGATITAHARIYFKAEDFAVAQSWAQLLTKSNIAGIHHVKGTTLFINAGLNHSSGATLQQSCMISALYGRDSIMMRFLPLPY